jgi:hypothetical protein
MNSKVNTLPIPEAIAWYTGEVRKVTALKVGTPGKTERMKELSKIKEQLDRRIITEKGM